MNRRTFERYLRKLGCVFARRGGKHDNGVKEANRQEAPVPRHNEIKTGTMRNLCQQLNIPEPPRK